MGLAILAGIVLAIVALAWYLLRSVGEAEGSTGAKLAALAGGAVVAVVVVIVARTILGFLGALPGDPAARSPTTLVAGLAGGMTGGFFAGLLLCALGGWGFGFGDLRWDGAKCLIVASLMALGGYWFVETVSESFFAPALLAHVIMAKVAWWEFGRIEIGITGLTMGAGAMVGMAAGPFIFVILAAIVLGWYAGMWIKQAMPDAEE